VEFPAVQNAWGGGGLKRGLFTSNALKGARGLGAFYRDLMAGVATPKEASEGR